MRSVLADEGTSVASPSPRRQIQGIVLDPLLAAELRQSEETYAKWRMAIDRAGATLAFRTGDDVIRVMAAADLPTTRPQANGIGSPAVTAELGTRMERVCESSSAHILYLSSHEDIATEPGLVGPRTVHLPAGGIHQADIDELLTSGWPNGLKIEQWAIVESHPGERPAAYWETILGQSNGSIGCRAAHPERSCKHRDSGATFVNSLFSREPYTYPVRYPGFPDYFESIVNVLEWCLFDPIINERLEDPLKDDALRDYDRRLVMSEGYLHRTTRTAIGAAEYETEYKVFASIVNPKLAAAAYEVRTDDPGTVVGIRAALDLEPVSRRLESVRTVTTGTLNNTFSSDYRSHRLTVDLDITNSPLGARLTVVTTIDGPDDVIVEANTATELTVRRSAASPDPVSITRVIEILPFVSDARARDTEQEYPTGGFLPKFDDLFVAQCEFWREWWERWDIAIDGSPSDQQAIRYSLYQLRCHAPQSDGDSISATGLVGDGYGGQIFWDTELYMAPFFTFTEPHLTRRLLLFRWRTLKQARARARQLNAPGALYAWNTISGEESGVVFEASTAQYHINSAIAYAINEYVQATNDTDFMWSYGARIIWETALFLSHLGEFVPERGGAFCLNVVCGPDEYACGVDNNAYFNYMTCWHFDLALSLIDEAYRRSEQEASQLLNTVGLTGGEIQRIRDALERIYLPQPQHDLVIPQDDSYRSRAPVDMRYVAHYTDIRDYMHPLNLWRAQVTKQADVLLLFVLRPELFGEATKLANYRYYEPKTNHGSSLSPAIHSIVASTLDIHEHAYDYYRVASRLDLSDFKRNTWKGLHVAALGGSWMAVCFGFAGIRVTPTGVHVDPKVPKRWNSFSFAVKVRGGTLRVEIKRQTLTFDWAGDETIHVEVRKTDRAIAPHQSITIAFATAHGQSL